MNRRANSLDQPGRLEEQRLRHLDAQRLRGLHVDYEFERDRLLEGQVRRLGALEYPVDEFRALAPQFARVLSVTE